MHLSPHFRPARVLLGAALLLPALIGASVAGPAQAQLDLKARLLALLPEGTQAVNEMSWQRDPDLAAIELRMNQAVQSDPRWFREYFASHSADEQIPYHPKFGVTERDYVRYSEDPGVRLVKTGKLLKVTTIKQGNRLIFQGGAGTEMLRGVSLDLVSGELRIPEGYTAKSHAVNVVVAPGRVDAFGLPARKGWGWSINPTGAAGPGKTSVWARLTLVQFAGGPVLLSYNRAVVANGRQRPNETLDVMYEKKDEVGRH